jgi:predicted alpha/beta-fold hydrolase
LYFLTGNLQTLGVSLLDCFFGNNKSKKVQIYSETLIFPDGGETTLDWGIFGK